MSQHDNRHWNDRRQEGQMDQYAEQNRQQGGEPQRARGYGYEEDRRDWGNPSRRDDGMQHADPAQTSYGRYGAPDVRGQPSGGYSRPAYEPARRAYGQYERGDDTVRHGGYSQDEGRGRDRYDADVYGGGTYGGRGNQSSQSAYGYGYDDHDRGRYQGGAGGYRSNAGPYAGSQTYGGYGDQTGYGSGPGYGAHDPDYQQWRRQQMQSLDADYETWRGERYKKFSDEFSTWRKGRSSSDQDGGTTQRSGTASAGGPSDKAIGGSSGSK